VLCLVGDPPHVPEHDGRYQDDERDQITSSWTESAVTWNTKPTTTGSPVGVTTGSAGTWTQWTVTSIVQAQYPGSNNGFMIQDSAEDTSNILQTYMSRENMNIPELQLTYS
jgi:hypothetical protein